MSFLDNLENSLKSLESQDERDPTERQRQQGDRARALEAAPWAEKLKKSPYTHRLFDEAALAGHRLRAKVYMAWMDSNLKLEVRGRTVELRPTADGIVADYVELDGSRRSQPVDLNGDPTEFLRDWIG